MSNGGSLIPTPEKLEAELKETRQVLHQKVSEILNYADEMAFEGPAVHRDLFELTAVMFGANFNYCELLVRDAVRTRQLLDQLRQPVSKS